MSHLPFLSFVNGSVCIFCKNIPGKFSNYLFRYLDKSGPKCYFNNKVPNEYARPNCRACLSHGEEGVKIRGEHQEGYWTQGYEQEHSHEQSQGHEQEHSHEQDHSHEHGHGQGHGHENGHGRGHGHDRREFDLEKASLEEMLIRAGYLAGRKSGKHRGQRQILDILAVQPEMSQKALQERLEIEAGSLSELLAKLEEKGFLYRKRDEEDRRRLIVCLSEKGKCACQQDPGAADEDIFAVLGEEDREKLKDILERLLRQWKAERNTAGRGAEARDPEEEPKGRPEGNPGD